MSIILVEIFTISVKILTFFFQNLETFGWKTNYLGSPEYFGPNFSQNIYYVKRNIEHFGQNLEDFGFSKNLGHFGRNCMDFGHNL